MAGLIVPVINMHGGTTEKPHSIAKDSNLAIDGALSMQ